MGGRNQISKFSWIYLFQNEMLSLHLSYMMERKIHVHAIVCTLVCVVDVVPGVMEETALQKYPGGRGYSLN